MWLRTLRAIRPPIVKSVVIETLRFDDCASHERNNFVHHSLIRMATLEEVSLEDEIDQEILNSSTDDIINRTRLLENDIKV